MSELPPDYFNQPLEEVDPEVAEAVRGELTRQQSTLEMIASENFVPRSILECQGSVLTNKYAEGYPGRRYYGGCEWVDVTEQLAIDRAKTLFGAEHANVQPHSGAQANTAVYHALLQPGDTIMGLSLAHGGHLTHGMKVNVSGRLYDIAAYEVDRDTGLIDMDEVAQIARERRPKLLLAGWSAYPRQLDFPRFRQIANEVGALLMVDMAHFAGLVAAGLHPSPVPYADVVSTTTHKTIGGPRAGMILCTEQHAKKIDSAVFPGQQGGPLQHVIAAKAVALRIAASESFRERQRRTVEGAKALAEELMAEYEPQEAPAGSQSAGSPAFAPTAPASSPPSASVGSPPSASAGSPSSAPGETPGRAHGSLKVLTGGTDVHLVLVDLQDLRPELTGRQAEDRLHGIGITVNRNAVPFDPRPPMEASGLRIGTAALATRGLQRDDFAEIGEIIVDALSDDFEQLAPELKARVSALVERYPLYESLAAPV
jgi:glycine hydroxymethyltransferase